MKGQIVGVLLAAGFSTRFGANKLLHCLNDGTPLAIAAARNLIQGIPLAVAVIGPGNDPLGELIEREGLDVVVNDRAGEGMGTSLAYGVKATSEAMGWVIALADMPFIRPATIRSLAERMQGGAIIAAPTHGQRHGHPVGFARSLYSELSRLKGERVRVG